MSDFPVVLKIVKLPDGRWASENGQGVKELTPEDLQQILAAFKMWWAIQWDMKRGR